jgi:hypothetical protein
MRARQYFYAFLLAIPLTSFWFSVSFAVNLRYTWMLPKTVIDATIAYTFEECSKDKIQVKITPTLIARTIPDPLAGQLDIDVGSLQSMWEDRNVSIQTFSGSRILSSMGSNPTSQVAQIVGNVLGGITKLVGIALGTSPVAIALNLNAVTRPQCIKEGEPNYADSPEAVTAQIKDLKSKIKAFQADLASGVDEAAQKKDNAAILAAQGLITNLQDQLTITIKTTIDPGVSPVNVNPDNDTSAVNVPTRKSVVDHSGLVATICPSQKQLDKAKWFGNVEQIFKGANNSCAAIPDFQVSVYLDFPNGQGTMYDPTHDKVYEQTQVVNHEHLYRDVAYIPVLVWRGAKPTKTTEFALGEAPLDLVPLIAPQSVAFGQFGVSQSLPLTADAFKSLTWQVTFLENGQITSASFQSKSIASGATSMFNTAASAANAIATEDRNARNPSNQATLVQGQADLIYETQRLELCQKHPESCTSK